MRAERHGSRERKGARAAWTTAAVTAALAMLAACSTQQAPSKPTVQTTKAFDAVFGKLPAIPLQAPAYATVVYFPSAADPGRFLPAPIFMTEAEKVEFLTVRTAVRGIDQEAFEKGIALPFPKGSDLLSFRREQGKAIVRLGGTFRAGSLSKEEADRAAAGLFLTARQFGEVTTLEISDAAGKTVFEGRPGDAETVDPGDPRALGVLAIRDAVGRPASALSLLFDRPVFIEEVAFYPPAGESPIGGKSYATGFGMSVEFHPDAGVTFDTKSAYRIRFKVRDGKGRTATGEVRWVPKDVVRI